MAIHSLSIQKKITLNAIAIQKRNRGRIVSYQKSFGVPNQVHGAMTAPTINTHSQVLSAGIKVLSSSAIKIMKTVVPPN